VGWDPGLRLCSILRKLAPPTCWHVGNLAAFFLLRLLWRVLNPAPAAWLSLSTACHLAAGSHSAEPPAVLSCCRLYRRYMRSVRSEAPYLPSNVEFIARNNGVACMRHCTDTCLLYRWPSFLSMSRPLRCLQLRHAMPESQKFTTY
jgi:hypothetical protein